MKPEGESKLIGIMRGGCILKLFGYCIHPYKLNLCLYHQWCRGMMMEFDFIINSLAQMLQITFKNEDVESIDVRAMAKR